MTTPAPKHVDINMTNVLTRQAINVGGIYLYSITGIGNAVPVNIRNTLGNVISGGLSRVLHPLIVNEFKMPADLTATDVIMYGLMQGGIYYAMSFIPNMTGTAMPEIMLRTAASGTLTQLYGDQVIKYIKSIGSKTDPTPTPQPSPSPAPTPSLQASLPRRHEINADSW